MWQHMCSLNSPELMDTLVIARAIKGREHTPEEHTPEEHTILSHALKHKKAQAHASRPAPFVIPLSGDNLFSTPKTSQSFANSNLRHLQHSSDSDCFQVPETLWSTSYSEPLPAVPNTTAHSLHSDPSSNTPSEDYSETSTSSEGSLETSSDSVPSDPNSAPTFLGDSPSHSRDKVAPTASDIKGCIIKVICDIKGQGWSGSVGSARQWPWL